MPRFMRISDSKPSTLRVGGNRGNEASGNSRVAAVAQQWHHVGVLVFQHVTNLWMTARFQTDRRQLVNFHLSLARQDGANTRLHILRNGILHLENVHTRAQCLQIHLEQLDDKQRPLVIVYSFHLGRYRSKYREYLDLGEFNLSLLIPIHGRGRLFCNRRIQLLNDLFVIFLE